jgi:uncharacterized protein YjdB
MMKRTFFLGALFFFGCTTSVSSIDVSPENPIISSKQTSLTLLPTAKDKGGKPLPKTTFAYRSLTPSVVSVEASGAVSAVKSGRGTVLISAGKTQKEVGILVQIPKQVRIDLDNPVLMVGISRTLKATVVNDQDEPMIAGEVRWASNNPAVVKVNDSGNLKTLQEGEATVTAHAAGLKGSVKVTVKHESVKKDGSLTQ